MFFIKSATFKFSMRHIILIVVSKVTSLVLNNCIKFTNCYSSFAADVLLFVSSDVFLLQSLCELFGLLDSVRQAVEQSCSQSEESNISNSSRWESSQNPTHTLIPQWVALTSFLFLFSARWDLEGAEEAELQYKQILQNHTPETPSISSSVEKTQPELAVNG